MTEKLATLTVTINDSRSKPIDSVELSDFVILPNETLVYAYPELYIPGNASIGVATAFACAFTEPVSGKGVPYCPQVSTHFAVTIPLGVHDIAVLSLSPSANVVSVGEIVSVNVKVKNQGDFTESFNVTAFYDSHTIGMIFINDMSAGINETFVFHWLTQDVEVGNYTLSVSAGPVADEKNLANNYSTDGVVNVKPQGPLIVHDTAVVNVVPASTSANIGDTLNVNVTVKNKGTTTESFNVILYYSQNVIGSLRISNLASGSQTAVTFNWSTGSVTAGTYNLTAFAVPVPGETSIADNYFEDGSVKLTQSNRGFFGATWFFWLLLLLLVALLILVPLLWFYYRRRRRDQESFATGWTAWYYGSDLLSRSTKKK
jgi:hypothetical protein